MSTLSPPDQEALDALVEARFDVEALPEQHRERAQRLVSLLAALDHLPEESGSSDAELTDRTLQRIRRLRQPDMAAGQVAGYIGGGPPMSLRDLVAIAAILVVSVSVLWPMLAHSRHSARQIACQANLATAGHALFEYAAAHDGVMPRTKARAGNDHWWLTGQFDEQGHAQSNSAHLFMLIRSGFASLKQLTCPENASAPRTMKPGMKDWANCEQCSYSYQNQYTKKPRRLQNGPVIATLADKNPFFTRGQYRGELNDDTNSSNHGRNGQNVLMTDGRVSWLTEPRLNNEDNIYHVGVDGHDRYTGRETPNGMNDSFLVP